MRSILITAGATRNPIDAMRCITAGSSGATGVALAFALAGALGRSAVTLLGSPEAILRAGDAVDTEPFGSTRDLMARMQRWVAAHPGGIVVHAAAVGDYEAPPFAGKLSSGAAELTITLRPTPKIVDHLKGWDPTMFLVSFKAAPPDTDAAQLRAIAAAQAARTGSDLVFANVLGRLGEDVQLVRPDAAERFAERAAGLDALREALLRAAGR